MKMMCFALTSFGSPDINCEPIHSVWLNLLLFHRFRVDVRVACCGAPPEPSASQVRETRSDGMFFFCTSVKPGQSSDGTHGNFRQLSKLVTSMIVAQARFPCELTSLRPVPFSKTEGVWLQPHASLLVRGANAFGTIGPSATRNPGHMCARTFLRESPSRDGAVIVDCCLLEADRGTMTSRLSLIFSRA